MIFGIVGDPDVSGRNVSNWRGTSGQGQPTDNVTGQKRKILILEDERLVAENLKELLEENGYEVVGISASGNDAIRKTAATEPDVLLLDIRVKGDLDGIQTAAIIQSMNLGKRAIVFLTAHPRGKFPHLDLLEQDFAYLTKPYSPEDLLAAIRSSLQKASNAKSDRNSGF